MSPDNPRLYSRREVSLLGLAILLDTIAEACLPWSKQDQSPSTPLPSVESGLKPQVSLETFQQEQEKGPLAFLQKTGETLDKANSLKIEFVLGSRALRGDITGELICVLPEENYYYQTTTRVVDEKNQVRIQTGEIIQIKENGKPKAWSRTGKTGSWALSNNALIGGDNSGVNGFLWKYLIFIGSFYGNEETGQTNFGPARVIRLGQYLYEGKTIEAFKASFGQSNGLAREIWSGTTERVFGGEFTLYIDSQRFLPRKLSFNLKDQKGQVIESLEVTYKDYNYPFQITPPQ